MERIEYYADELPIEFQFPKTLFETFGKNLGSEVNLLRDQLAAHYEQRLASLRADNLRLRRLVDDPCCHLVDLDNILPRGEINDKSVNQPVPRERFSLEAQDAEQSTGKHSLADAAIDLVLEDTATGKTVSAPALLEQPKGGSWASSCIDIDGESLPETPSAPHDSASMFGFERARAPRESTNTNLVHLPLSQKANTRTSTTFNSRASRESKDIPRLQSLCGSMEDLGAISYSVQANKVAPSGTRVERLAKLFKRLTLDHEELTAARMHSILRIVHGRKCQHKLKEVERIIDDLHASAGTEDQKRISQERKSRPSVSSEWLEKASTAHTHGPSRHSLSIPQTVSRQISDAKVAAAKWGHHWHHSHSHNDPEPEVHAIDCDMFCRLITWDELSKELDLKLARECYSIRDALIKHGADLLIAFYARLTLPEDAIERPFIMRIIEPLSGCVILLNSLTIGLSADISWEGWGVFELIFTLFFTLEIMLKFFYNGWRDQLWGEDKSWNYFDMALVAMAIADLLLQQMLESSDFNMRDFTLARLARLAKVTRLMRLLRLLRLRIFKELLLMVRGVIAGLRTLFWAIVLLLFLVYAAAVALMQTVGEAKIAIHDQYNTVLFDSLPWSMFNVFRCFMSDGTLPDGTPLVGHLEAKYGPVFVIPYTLCTLFIVFGIFNLIAAIFVENVIESARAKRELAEEGERVRVALSLRQLLLKFCGHKEVSIVAMTRSSSSKWSRASSIIATMSKTIKLWSKPEEFSFQDEAHDVFEIDGVITRDMFERAIRDPETLDMLDALEIQMSDRTELFDVLDADNSGEIDISEMISGLMKMRSGGADRSDSVATILSLRSVQTVLRGFKDEFGVLCQLVAKGQQFNEELKESFDDFRMQLYSDNVPEASDL